MDLLRSNAVVALGTALSRLTGLLRVTVFAAVIGQTALADAYNGANSSPNAVYELLLGGVLSAALVPVFTRHLENDDDESRDAIVSTAIVALATLTAVAVAVAPWIFRLWSINPSDDVDADQFRSVGTALARIFLIQIFFYGLSALLGSILNAHRRFFAATWSPVLANLAIICSLLLVPGVIDGAPGLGDVQTDSTLRWLLGLGATLGIALQALVLLPAVRRAGVRLRFRPQWRHPAVREMAVLSTWTFGYVAANQVAALVISNVALGIGAGQQDAYVKASIIFLFPHGLLAMSIAITFVPEMARSVTRRDRDEFVRTSTVGIRLVALVTMPAAFLLFALRGPVVSAFFRYGEFTTDDVATTARALAGFSLGLAGFSVYLFALRGFYAHRDTRTPFVLSVVQNGLNIVLALVLFDRFGVLGLGAAYAMSYVLAALLAVRVLANKVRGFDLRAIAGSVGRMLLAGVVAAEIAWLVTSRVGGTGRVAAFADIAVGGAVGLAVYAALLTWMKVSEVEMLRERLSRATARGRRDG